MSLRTLPEAVIYQDEGKKRQVLPRYRYKETGILIVNTEAFFEVEVKVK